MRAATNNGTCQCCGAIQRLPAGVLAKHGYTVEYSFFNGVCRGSGYKPYEESCELIRKFITQAAEQRTALETKKAEILARVGSTAFVHMYGKRHHSSKSGYYWEETEIKLNDTGHYFTYVFTGRHSAKDSAERLPLYDHTVKTVEQAASAMNARYVKEVIERDIAGLDRYIVWQAHRLQEWKLTDLLPLR